MKCIRVEIFQDPPRERVLVDGKELSGVTFEVAFLDAPSTSLTLHEFVTRVGTVSVAGGGNVKSDNNKQEGKEPVGEVAETEQLATPATETTEGGTK